MRALKIAELGDIHLGHHNTPTLHVLRSLQKALPDNQTTAELDLIILAGDVFDRELTLPDADVFAIRQWIYNLLGLCIRHDIVLIVLEGTPSHDWQQSKEFLYANQEHYDNQVDVHYANRLSIEYIEKLEATFLYVPDEWRTDNDVTWQEVLGLLQARGLERVDFAIMHGAFEYQMPERLHARMNLHKSERYLSIVNHYVFIGHVHLHSQFDKILAAGSLDRLAHGEEASKGHLRVHIRPDGNDSITFVPNSWAMAYITIDCHGLAADVLSDKIAGVVDKLEAGHIRLRANRLDPALSQVDVFRKVYPHLRWTVKAETENETQRSEMVDLRSSISTVQLTKANISEIVLARVSATRPDMLEVCERLLANIV